MFKIAVLIAIGCVVAAASITKRQDTEDFQETVVFIRKQTNFGQNVFVRGGVGNGEDCFEVGGPTGEPADDPCGIPIRHLELDMDVPTRDSWADSDEFLTWTGAEPNQQQDAAGTPAQWTTSDQSNDYFHSLNSYGSDYWMVHMEMNCSVLEDGFFDVKGFLDNRWETDIEQADCTGDAAATPPYSSINHIARCGYINVFEWGSNNCKMESF